MSRICRADVVSSRLRLCARSCLIVAGLITGASQAPCAAEPGEQKQPAAIAMPMAGAALIANASPAAVMAPNAYRLDFKDKLRVRFLDRYDREDLNGDYTVNELGQLTLPRIGQFDAKGKTVDELMDLIRRTIEGEGQQLGYLTVDIIEHRPFYVLGFANRPGAYPYVPGMTVLHAVALAGGYYRASPTVAIDAMREGSKAVDARQHLNELLMKRARLEAERADAETIIAPEELLHAKLPEVDELVKREQAVLARQRELDARERVSLERIIEFTKRETESLQAEIITIAQQRQAKKKMFDQIKQLFDKGLANQQRYMETLAATEMAERDSQMAIAQLSRAQATLEKADRDLAMLTLEHQAKTAREIATVEVDIVKTRALLESIRGVALALNDMQYSDADKLAEMNFEILRPGPNGKPAYIDASETTLVEPGDVIKICPGRPPTAANRASE